MAVDFGSTRRVVDDGPLAVRRSGSRSILRPVVGTDSRGSSLEQPRTPDTETRMASFTEPGGDRHGSEHRRPRCPGPGGRGAAALRRVAKLVAQLLRERASRRPRPSVASVARLLEVDYTVR